jgi:putative serine protease PepD
VSTSLFDPTPRDDPDDHEPAPPRRNPPSPPSAPPPTSGHGRRRIAAMLAASALAGGLVAGGVVALVDGGGSSSTTTIVRPSENRTVSNSSGGLDPKSLYAGAAGGVVDITSQGVSSDQSSSENPFGFPQQPQQGTATGTGFVVDEDGNIVTAAHVVDGASSITVTFQDGTTRSAKLLGKDDATDVAVLKVDPSGVKLQPLALGNSSALGAGDALAVIGDPFGYARSISTGIVSGLDRTIQAPNGFTVAHAIQTDAAMNPGNSGGPVFNADGQVIGIADQIATGGSANANTGVGFLVPIDLVKSELPQLKAGQDVRHAFLGVSTSDASTANSTGALIGQITAGGPAADAGLQQGDVVTQIGSTQIHDSGDLVAAVSQHKPGEKVDITVRRSGKTQKVTVTLGTQPSSAPQQTQSTTP